MDKKATNAFNIGLGRKILPVTRFSFEMELDYGAWNKHNFSNGFNARWKMVKVYESINKYSKEFNSIKNNLSGVFMCVISPDIELSCYSYVMYIGESESNIKKMFSDITSETAVSYKSIITFRELFKKYSEHLYICYCEETDKNEIAEIYKKYTEAIHPVLNNYSVKMKVGGATNNTWK